MLMILSLLSQANWHKRNSDLVMIVIVEIINNFLMLMVIILGQTVAVMNINYVMTITLVMIFVFRDGMC